MGIPAVGRQQQFLNIFFPRWLNVCITDAWWLLFMIHQPRGERRDGRVRSDLLAILRFGSWLILMYGPALWARHHTCFLQHKTISIGEVAQIPRVYPPKKRTLKRSNCELSLTIIICNTCFLIVIYYIFMCMFIVYVYTTHTCIMCVCVCLAVQWAWGYFISVGPH